MVQVGELVKYYRKGKRGDEALHPVLYAWRDTGRVCISEADADLFSINALVAEYDVSEILFEYPARMYGYPEIYKPSNSSVHYSYTHRLFDQEADVWMRSNYEDNGWL